MTSLERRIAAATRRCQRLAMRRNEAMQQQKLLSPNDDNYWHLEGIMESCEITYSKTQRKIHAMEQLRRDKAKIKLRQF